MSFKLKSAFKFEMVFSIFCIRLIKYSGSFHHVGIAEVDADQNLLLENPSMLSIKIESFISIHFFCNKPSCQPTLLIME